MNIIHLLRSRCSRQKVRKKLYRNFSESLQKRVTTKLKYVLSLTSIYLESPFRTDRHSTRKKSCSRKVRSMTRISVCKAHLSGEKSELLCDQCCFLWDQQVLWRTTDMPLSPTVFSPPLLYPTNCVVVTRARMDRQVEGQRQRETDEQLIPKDAQAT